MTSGVGEHMTMNWAELDGGLRQRDPTPRVKAPLKGEGLVGVGDGREMGSGGHQSPEFRQPVPIIFHSCV